MNINFNTNVNTNATMATAAQARDAAIGAAEPKRSADISISTVQGRIGDLPEIDFPDDEATARTDRLGELVKAAFSLPAPPPDFMSRV